MTNPEYTHLALIVDRSGSMHTISGDMNGAIKNLLAEQDAQEGKLLVDITTFDDAIEFPYTDAEASTIVEDIIMPRGTTSLLDAIGITMTRLGRKFSLMPEDERPSNVIIVIVTDGYENSSKEYTRSRIALMVKEQEEKWNWTFLYLAANVDAFATGAGMGFRQGQTISYMATAGSTQSVYDAASASATRVRKGGSADFTDDERDAAKTS